jgi:hypothetical protein
MDFIMRRTLWGAILLTTACGSSHETMRGKAHIHVQPMAPEDEKDESEDAIIQAADPNQAPVVFDKNAMQPLMLTAEADQSGLPAGLIDDIFAIHKIDDGKTLLFGKSKQAWLLDESKEGLLTRLTLDITPPGDATLYVLENNNFWLLGKNSLGFPSTSPSKDPTQVTMINLAPDLLKDANNPPKVLYAGPQRMILATEMRANIVLLDGDKARVIALDLPKMGAMPVPIRGAGIMKGAESFWFLSNDFLLLLKKNDENRWRWVISPFQVKTEAQNPEGTPQFAMMLEAQNDRSFAFVGRTFEFTSGRLYEQKPLKLSVDIKADPALDPLFTGTIQPMLTSYCAPCHSGYEDFINVKAKAAVYHQVIADGSMPKNMALQPEQIKTLTDYLTKVIAMP